MMPLQDLPNKAYRFRILLLQPQSLPCASRFLGISLE
jgi:hypothetical protein